MSKTGYKRNNYCLPPEGQPAIESVCFYDTWMSQQNFNENIEHVGKSESVFYFIDYGNVKGVDSVSFTIGGSRSDKEKYALADDYRATEESIKDWTDSELDEVILDSFDPRISLSNYESESEWLSKEYNLTIKPSKELIKIITKGYSQGDYAQVWYSPSDLESVWGNQPDESELKKLFHNYFWDAPIHCKLTIDDKEYSYTEWPGLKSEYEWDKEGFLQWVSKESGVDTKTLNAYLPEYPDYN